MSKESCGDDSGPECRDSDDDRDDAGREACDSDYDSDDVGHEASDSDYDRDDVSRKVRDSDDGGRDASGEALHSDEEGHDSSREACDSNDGGLGSSREWHDSDEGGRDASSEACDSDGAAVIRSRAAVIRVTKRVIPTVLTLFCWRGNKTHMARLKRSGKMETFSVSVSSKTKVRLLIAADRAYGGNVSALIEAIALEADRQAALDWLLHRAPPIDDDTFEAFAKEMAGPRRKRPRSAA